MIDRIWGDIELRPHTGRSLSRPRVAAPIARIIAVALILVSNSQRVSSADYAPDPRLLHYLDIAAEKGDAAAQTELGKIYEGGDGLARDAEKSLESIRKAADQNYAEAEFELGLTYELGEEVEQDSRERPFYMGWQLNRDTPAQKTPWATCIETVSASQRMILRP